MRGDGDPGWAAQTRDCSHNQVGSCIDHGYGPITMIRHISARSIWSNCDPYWEVTHRDRGDDSIRGCIDNGDVGRRRRKLKLTLEKIPASGLVDDIDPRSVRSDREGIR